MYPESRPSTSSSVPDTSAASLVRKQHSKAFQDTEISAPTSEYLYINPAKLNPNKLPSRSEPSNDLRCGFYSTEQVQSEQENGSKMSEAKASLDRKSPNISIISKDIL